MPSCLDTSSDARTAFLNHYRAQKKLANRTNGQAPPGKTKASKRSRAERQSSKVPSLKKRPKRTLEEPKLISPPKLTPVEYDYSAVAPIKHRPHNLALQTLWKGLEPEIESTFLIWDKVYGKAPDMFVCQALGAFEAGQNIEGMHGDLKTALVHIVAMAMITQRLHPESVTMSQIEYFLLEAYRWIKSNTQVPTQELPRKEHWLYGTTRLRSKELDWLLFQAERRWWVLMTRAVERLEEPSDVEIEALFQTYTEGGDYVGTDNIT